MSLLLLISRSSTSTARTVSTAALTGSVTGLVAASSYDARVRARDAAGNWSAWSSTITFSTLSVPVPATVVAIAAVPGPLVNQSPNTPATVAAVAAIAAPAAGFQRSQTPTGTTASFTGLIPGRSYSARVRARDAAGNWSAFSTPVSFSTLGTPSPATVAAVTAFPAATVGGSPPTVTAGRARPVVRSGTVLLDVTATPPGAESIIGYNWAITAGGGSLTNATTATPTYTAPGSGSGLVIIRSTVSATNGGQAFADMTVSYHGTIIAAENALTGTARATWDLASPNLGGVSTLQGFADGFTVNRNATVNFKIAQSDTAGWSAEVFRLGYYGGDGARSYGTLTPSGGQVTTSQAQPTPGDADANTTLLSADAGNWSTTLTWTPPAWAPTGMYVLRLNRTGGGASHVMFILRDDARHADLMFMPADSTWNAYNAWGGMGGSMYSGNSLYYGTSVDQYNADAARYVSYNRPVVNRGAADSGRSYGAVEWSTFFTSEYGMLRFLERNGYDVKYYGCIDAGGDSTGTHLTGNGGTRGGASAGVFVGHNEYWSDGMRSGWETAKTAGVSVFSCAGNEVFWRLVGSANDAESRPRTWECFKSTIAARASTGRTEWTGTWRDPDGAGKGGNQPENTFTGTIFVVNGPDLRSLVVPYNGGYSGQPLWRGTSVASLTAGQSFTSGNQILGFEWDTYGPAGVSTSAASFLAAPHQSARYCSDVTYSISSGLLLTDAGDVYNAAGTATHRLVVMPSGNNGGITFGTGTVNWALGLDNANTYQQGTDQTDTAIQQATINILADMGAQPASVMGGMSQQTAVDWFANPGTVVAVAAIPSATVVATASTTATPTAVVAVAAVPAPVVRGGALATPATVAATADVPSSTVRLSVLPAPATVTGAATVPAPAIHLSALPTPAAVAAVATVPSPTVQLGAMPTPATVAGTATVPAVSVQTASGSTAAPSTVVAVAAVPAVSVQTSSSTTATPPTVAATTTVAAVTVRLSVLPAPTVVVAVASVPAVSVATSTNATPTPATVTGVASVGAIGIGGGTAVSPATVTATAAVPAPTVRAGAAPAPSAVTAVAGVASPSLGAAAAAQPSTVAAVSAVGAPAITATNSPTPGTVVAVSVIPAGQTQTGSRALAVTVAATVTIPGPTVGVVTSPPVATVVATAGIPNGQIRIFAAVTVATIAATVTIGQIRHIVGQVVTSTGSGTVTGGQLPGTVVGVTHPGRLI